MILQEGLRRRGLDHVVHEREVTIFCEHVDGPSGSVKCEKFLGHLTNSYCLKKDSPP